MLNYKNVEEPYPLDYYSRSILLEEDAKSLLWFSKIKVIGLLSFLFFFSSCVNSTPMKAREDFVNYYNGVVLGHESLPLENVEVNCILDDSLVLSVFTNKDGYFKIQDSSFTSLNLQINSRELLFNKNGYESMFIRTIQVPPNYLPKRSDTEGMFFIFPQPDTVRLIKNK